MPLQRSLRTLLRIARLELDAAASQLNIETKLQAESIRAEETIKASLNNEAAAFVDRDGKTVALPSFDAWRARASVALAQAREAVIATATRTGDALCLVQEKANSLEAVESRCAKYEHDERHAAEKANQAAFDDSVAQSFRSGTRAG